MGDRHVEVEHPFLVVSGCARYLSGREERDPLFADSLALLTPGKTTDLRELPSSAHSLLLYDESHNNCIFIEKQLGIFANE